ncbi:CTP synthase [Acetilactobacillus jinshanensis]|uniref:CTP synthase n=1 Tax=Acetilactobacillus jinshanensis TaxID=1720083 RepID=UPI003CE55CDA
MTKYIFVTGGVCSSLGKGIVSASIGRLLKNRGLNITIQKCDPYINVDPGTMSPYQHGEVFVTDDGAETDLDLGHYERFIDNNLNKYSNLTTGQVYSEVISKERHGDYLGACVQVIPHITGMIKSKIEQDAKKTNADVVITEIGGTVGDMESLPFLEAIREMKNDVGANNVCYVHVTLVPYLHAAKEMKTKPTQHSVQKLQAYGIHPNFIVTRNEKPMTPTMIKKISLFCDVPTNAVVQSLDEPTIYAVPLILQKQGLDEGILKHLGIKAPKANMTEWKKLTYRVLHLKKTLNIDLVGKYVSLKDAYISVDAALKHAGYPLNSKVNINYIDAEKITNDKVAAKILGGADGILIPGGFGSRGIEGMIRACRYARVHNVPYLGICLGMQIASIEFARDVLGEKDANSTEFDPYTPHKVIDLMADQSDINDMGGTQRLGSYPCKLKPGTVTAKAYGGKKLIHERHRHRYEFNNAYRKPMTKHGLVISGTSPDNHLVEVVELPNKKSFVGSQYHPEFLSRPTRPEGLFKSFVKAAFGQHYSSKSAK